MEYLEDLVSIVMPCRNSGAYVREAVNSVLAQTWTQWELIAIDDASQDETASILKTFAGRDSRIIAKTLETPGGAGRARNMALDMAKGRYAAFLDFDDLWRPEKLELQLRYMRQHDLALCATQLETIGQSGEAKGAYLPRPGAYDFNFLLRENVAGTSAMMVDRLKCPDLRFGPTKRQEDYYAWMNQAARGHKVHIMPGQYTRYRLRPFSLPAKLRDAGTRLYINHRYLKVGCFRQSAIFAPYIMKSLCKMKNYYDRQGSAVETAGESQMNMSVAGRVMRRLYQENVTERDRVLLDLVFSSSLTQRELDKALEVCDIEVLGGAKSLLLSYIMRDRPDLRFSGYAAPRLRGLINYYRFANMRVLSHFSRIGRALNAAGIPMLVFKGGAMRILRPELYRPMSDVDILVPPGRLAEAVKIGERLGYHDAMTGSNTAVDLHAANDESALDIHHAVFETGGGAEAFHRGLFARARETEAFGVRVWLPAHEDLAFIVLANLTKNLRGKTSLRGLFYALLDFKFLLADKPGFDWGIVRENIKNTDAELPVRFGAEFMNSLVPGIVPDIDLHLPLSPKMEAYCEQVIFDEDFFHPFQAVCRAIRVADLKNHPRHFGKMIVKFLLLKKLREIPAFVRWHLKTRESRSAG